MRAVLDTNVFVSGVFFAGPPHQVLRYWRDRILRPVISAEILDEYQRVGLRLSSSYPGVDLRPFLRLLERDADFVTAEPLPEQVCEDPTDDKFLACALAAGVEFVVSGDKLLLKVSRYEGVRVVSPRTFLEVIRKRL